MLLKCQDENWESTTGIVNLGVPGDLERNCFNEVIGMKL